MNKIILTSVALLAFLSGCSHLTFERQSLDPVQQYFSQKNQEDRQKDSIRAASHDDYAKETSFYRPRDVSVGMSMSGVRDSWGEPYQVDYAGDYRYGNQRWVYPLGATSHLGQSEARIVYFENGRVIGWETY